MSRTNFFQQAPVQDTYQKRFLDAVLNKKPLITSFPLGYPMVSLYALSAMMSGGLAVIVCHNSDRVKRNLDYFHRAGLRFPDVAFLDGTQMPHEERLIHQEINRNRVRVLYIAPERFVSLTFLEVLVHQTVTFLAIEEAERMLPDSPGHAPYQKLYEQGLRQLAQLPPLILMTPVITPARVALLGERLGLQDVQWLHCSPSIDTVELQVKCLLSEHQKFKDLVTFLSGSQAKNELGRLDAPGSVIIRTAFPAQAEKLGASLMDYGFDFVWVTHYKKPYRDQMKAVEAINVQANAILVSAGTDIRGWEPPGEVEPKLIYWTPPGSLDEVFMHVFRQPSEKAFTDVQPVRARIYHTKEDFMTKTRPLKPEHGMQTPQDVEALKRLNEYRRWVFDEACRLQSAADYLQDPSYAVIPPCGRCDRCTETHDLSWKLRRVLKHWLY